MTGPDGSSGKRGRPRRDRAELFADVAVPVGRRPDHHRSRCKPRCAREAAGRDVEFPGDHALDDFGVTLLNALEIGDCSPTDADHRGRLSTLLRFWWRVSGEHPLLGFGFEAGEQVERQIRLLGDG